MTLIAVACLILGALFLWRFFKLKKEKESEEKGFIVIGATLLAIWLFPGAALLIVGLVLIAIFGGCGGCM